MIRIGTAGWQYRDWAGIVYPQPKPRGFDELSYLASFFNVVEINSSFYGPPRANASRTWVARISGNPEFRFTAKLWKGFTHDRNATTADEKLFKEGIEPLADSGLLGALLLQFPWSFKNEPENRTYLWQLRERFAEYRLCSRSDTVAGSSLMCWTRLRSGAWDCATSINLSFTVR